MHPVQQEEQEEEEEEDADADAPKAAEGNQPGARLHPGCHQGEGSCSEESAGLQREQGQMRLAEAGLGDVKEAVLDRGDEEEVQEPAALFYEKDSVGHSNIPIDDWILIPSSSDQQRKLVCRYDHVCHTVALHIVSWFFLRCPDPDALVLCSCCFPPQSLCTIRDPDSALLCTWSFRGTKTRGHAYPSDWLPMSMRVSHRVAAPSLPRLQTF